MKMKEDPSVWELIQNLYGTYREQGISAALAGGMAALRSMYNGGGWKKTSIDGLMCAAFGWFVKDLLLFFGLNQDLSYLASVYIGYIGSDAVIRVIKNRTGVKHD